MYQKNKSKKNKVSQRPPEAARDPWRVERATGKGAGEAKGIGDAEGGKHMQT